MVFLRSKTRRVWMDDGLVHLVDVAHKDGKNFYTHMWCEAGDIEWENPPFTKHALTCMWCAAARRP